jgi:Flp pilus assembly protein TadG
MRTLLQIARDVCRGRGGFAMVEFALGSGVLLAAFSGTFEIGYAALEYSKLQAAVAQGARYAAMIPYDSATSTPSTAFSTAVKNMVVYGTPAGGTAPVAGNLVRSNVVVSVTFANGVPSTVEVSISGYSIDALFARISLTGKPAAIFPYYGVWAPV